jgi:hypothetical protein
MDRVVAAGLLLIVAAGAFVGSIRVGMLLGRRLDRRLEAAAAVGSRPDETGESPEEDA